MLALLSILSLFQGVPFPGPGANFSRGNNIVSQNACVARLTTAGTSWSFAINGSTNCGNTFTPTAGDQVTLYFGFVNQQSSGTPVLTSPDAQGNTWTCSFDSTSKRQFICFSLLSTTANVSEALSVSNSSVMVGVSGEWSGTQNVIDGGGPAFKTVSPSTTAWSGTAVTTTNALDIVIGCATNAGVASTYTAGGSFALYAFLQNSAQINGGCESQIVTSTGTYTPTITMGTSITGPMTTLALKSQ
jgi:hypothetical protein